MFKLISSNSMLQSANKPLLPTVLYIYWQAQLGMSVPSNILTIGLILELCLPLWVAKSCGSHSVTNSEAQTSDTACKMLDSDNNKLKRQIYKTVPPVVFLKFCYIWQVTNFEFKIGLNN